MFDLIIKGGLLWLPTGLSKADVAIVGGRVASIGVMTHTPASTILEVRGLHVLPGVIDTQVHFREPGLEHKENLESGSKAAVLGGITAICEMPNTQPPTSNIHTLIDKMLRARSCMACDYAFFLGATSQNISSRDICPQVEGYTGLKIFTGSSTGTLLLENNHSLAYALEKESRRVAIHCENNACIQKNLTEATSVIKHTVWRDITSALQATYQVLQLAWMHKCRVHVLHVSSAEEIELLRLYRELATVEVTPQHLTLVEPECYNRFGTLAQVNPPIRGRYHHSALWQAVRDGVVDCLGSDHAPHILCEKTNTYPTSPSGIPSVQTLVPIMLTHVATGKLSLGQFVQLTSAGPARVYGIANKGHIVVGFDGDFTIVDLKTHRTISRDWLVSLCGWSPFEGVTSVGWPIATVIRGHIVMRDNELLITAPIGRPIHFANQVNEKTLSDP